MFVTVRRRGLKWMPLAPSKWNSSLFVIDGSFQLPHEDDMPPTFSYMNEIKGRCHSIPSNLIIDVLYAEAGLINFFPVYTIVGVRIRYEKRNFWIVSILINA